MDSIHLASRTVVGFGFEDKSSKLEIENIDYSKHQYTNAYNYIFRNHFVEFVTEQKLLLTFSFQTSTQITQVTELTSVKTI